MNLNEENLDNQDAAQPAVDCDAGAETQPPEERMAALEGELQRARAAMDNARKRFEQEREQLLQYANSRLLVRLLPILDELSMALAAAPEDPANESWVEGVRLIERKFETAMAQEGLARIDALGKQFDPLEHEAVGLQETHDREDGEITQVIRPGYRLGERALRPAQVIVAKNSGH